MSTRSGSRTPWQEWEGDRGPEADVLLVRDGKHAGELSLLAEALRSDGVASGLAAAFRLVDQASFLYTYYGYREDDRHPTICDRLGITPDGDEVNLPRACVFAVIGMN